jgi:chromosome partitioning protein
MRTVTLISQKGGAGKTTLSINLAVAAMLDGKSVVIVDLDPQQSAARWARLRKTDDLVVVSGHGPNVGELVQRAKDGGADLVIIDTAPKSEGAALAAAKLADVVIIPCQPSSLDLDAIADSVNIVQLAKRPAFFVLNNCRASSPLADEAADALSDYGLPIAPVRFGSRVAFIKSLAEGKGVLECENGTPAATEVMKLHKYTNQ